jgi:glycine cleavage system H lipoate-binding protein
MTQDGETSDDSQYQQHNHENSQIIHGSEDIASVSLTCHEHRQSITRISQVCRSAMPTEVTSGRSAVILESMRSLLTAVI